MNTKVLMIIAFYFFWLEKGCRQLPFVLRLICSRPVVCVLIYRMENTRMVTTMTG
jgi:hypothetical protein